MSFHTVCRRHADVPSQGGGASAEKIQQVRLARALPKAALDS